MTDDGMSVDLIEWPTNTTYMQVKEVALSTMGLRPVTETKAEWLHMMCTAEHSPIRLMRYMYRIHAPYWVLNELRTHHVGCEMWMQSSRNDRQKGFDRSQAPQGMIREAYWEANAQSLMDVMHRRLCGSASKEMQHLARMIKSVTVAQVPWMEDLLVPMCEYRGGECHEVKCCGRCPAAQKKEIREPGTETYPERYWADPLYCPERL